MGDIQTWHVAGVKQSTTQAALTTALAALEGAYTPDGQNIVLKDNLGANTRHLVTSANTFSGVKVAHFGYPKGSWDMQTEYGSGNANKRTYEIVLTAEIRTGSASDLYAYREKVTQIGTGGPLQKYMGSLTGTPVLQTLRAEVPIRYVQEGYVIGRGTWLTVPSPLNFGVEMQEQRVIEVGSPMDVRVNGAELFKSSYRYVFERVGATVFSPTLQTL
jgi:hypothetical protein